MFASPSPNAISITWDFNVKVDHRETLNRVGQRYAFSPILIIASAPLLIGGFLATEISPANLADWWLYLAVGLIGQLVLAAVFLVARYGIFRSAPLSQKSPFAVLTTYFVASWLRVGANVSLMAQFGLENHVPLWSRLVTSAMLIPLAFGLGSYALESLRRYFDAREGLIRSIVQASTELERQQSVTESLRSSLLSRVDSQISLVNQETTRALSSLEAQIRRGEDVRPELRQLLDEADRKWRGIGHEALQAASISLPKATVSEFIQTLVVTKPLSYLALVSSGVFMFSLVLGRELPTSHAAAWSVLWVLVVTAVAFVVNEISSRVNRGAVPIFFAGFTLLLGFSVPLRLIPELPDLAGWGAVVVGAQAGLIALVVGSGPALSGNYERVLDSFRARLDNATIERLRVESELVLLAQKVASRLHANSRGVFLAKVLGLQRALDRGDHDGALKALGEMRQSLEVEVNTPQTDPDDSELLGFLDNWRGLVEIHTNLHTAVVPEPLHSSINTIVMDAVNDAIRHGAADWIEVTVDSDKTGTVLTITNNGTAPQGSRQGIGGHTLDRLATGGWTREVDVLGFTRLTARFRASELTDSGR